MKKIYIQNKTLIFIIILILISSTIYIITPDDAIPVRFYDYPQRIEYNKNTGMIYIAKMKTDTIAIYNVTDIDNIQEHASITDHTHLKDIHGLKIIPAWNKYTDIIIANGGRHTQYLTAYTNNQTPPQHLSTITITENTTQNGYIDTTIHNNHLYVIVTTTQPARLTLLDYTNPTTPILLDTIPTENQQPWMPYFHGEPPHVYLTSTAENKTITIYSFTNNTLQYKGYIPGSWQPFICIDKKRNKTYTVSTDSILYQHQINTYDNWTTVNHIPVESNGEMSLCIHNQDYLVLRHYIQNNTDEQHGIDFYQITDTIMYLGHYENGLETLYTHMMIIDIPDKKGFFLSYGGGCFYTLHITITPEDGVVCTPGDVISYYMKTEYLPIKKQ